LNGEGQQKANDLQLESTRRDRVDLLGEEAPQSAEDRFYVLADRLTLKNSSHAAIGLLEFFLR
jgi:hypothetical protein